MEILGAIRQRVRKTVQDFALRLVYRAGYRAWILALLSADVEEMLSAVKPAPSCAEWNQLLVTSSWSASTVFQCRSLLLRVVLFFVAASQALRELAFCGNVLSLWNLIQQLKQKDDYTISCVLVMVVLILLARCSVMRMVGKKSHRATINCVASEQILLKITNCGLRILYPCHFHGSRRDISMQSWVHHVYICKCKLLEVW